MDPLTAALRLLHIGGAILWIGASVLFTFFVQPAARAAGPAGGAFLGALMGRTRLMAFMPAVGITTILAGLLLYWDLGYMDAGAGSVALITLNVGVVAGLGMALMGFAVNMPRGKRMQRITAATARGGPPTPKEAGEMERLARAMQRGNQLFMVFALVAVVTMSTFRYL